MAITIQVVVDAEHKKALQKLAKSEGRSLSNLVGYLVVLGKVKYNELKQREAA